MTAQREVRYMGVMAGLGPIMKQGPMSLTFSQE